MSDRHPTAATSSEQDRFSRAGVPRTKRKDPGGVPERIAVDGMNAGTDPTEQIARREPLPAWQPRDILPPFVLLAVSLQRAHGYVIEDYLRALGLFGITMSTLYRTLRQMEKDGFLQSTWEPGPTGPARRVYTITDAGHTWLDSSATMLSTYRETIDRFFGLYDAGPGATRHQPDESPNEKEIQG